jgi:hypothetical protein
MFEMAIFSTVKATRGILLIMSKVRSSPEKKRISLAKDRRNVYGEAPPQVGRTSGVANSEATSKCGELRMRSFVL